LEGLICRGVSGRDQRPRIAHALTMQLQSGEVQDTKLLYVNAHGRRAGHEKTGCPDWRISRDEDPRDRFLLENRGEPRRVAVSMPRARPTKRFKKA
jgi:hypothetical protein